MCRRLSCLLLVLLAIGARQVSAQPEAEDGDVPVQVIVVPVTGEIGVRTVYMIQSGLREARARGVARLVLDIDTPGGGVVASREIDGLLADLVDADLRVVAFVRRHAWSAGAYVALACSEIFMAPGSSIGAITAVQSGPGGMRQIQDEDVRRKVFAALRADLRAMVERRGLRSDLALLAEAMVDPDLEVYEVTYVDDTGVQVTEIVDREGLRRLEAADSEILRRTDFPTRPLSLSAGEAARLGLSSGTVSSIEELVREEFLLPPESIVRRDETWSEEAVAWLDGIKPILFLLGFVLLLLELKTPGFAVAGVLGILMLGLAMFGSYLVGLAEWTEILLFFLGIALVGVEIFVLPGTVIPALLGVVCVVLGLVLSQQSFFVPATSGQENILLDNLLDILLLLVLVVACTIAAWKLLPYVPIFNRVLQPAPEPVLAGGTSFSWSEEVAAAGRALIGRTGVAGTDLRPVGAMDLDGERLDVMTRGTFVPRGTPIRVVAIELNQVVVEPVEDGLGEDDDAERGEVSLGFLVFLWLLGIGFVIAEVFFPSFGVLSVLAAVSIVSAVFLAYTHHGVGTGHLFLVTAAVAVPACLYLAFRLLPNTALGRRMLLSGFDRAEVTGSGEQPGLQRFLRQRGRAASALRPAGIARIGSETVDVVTRGEMIDKGERVVVVRVEGNRVVVTRDDETKNAPAAEPSPEE